jgi:hypothetical protein
MPRAINWLGYPVRIATIRHVCRLCGKPIEPGSIYRDGGKPRRAHLTCIDQVVPTLTCGHPNSHRMAFRYRCNLYSHPNGCREMHLTFGCSTCWDAGEGRPVDFGHEVSREHC